ncbi:MAG: hypothetical protein WCK35_24505 [Chloroflexota bacterium]
MSFLSDFETQLPTVQKNLFLGLNSPYAIQTYLNSMPYIAEERDRSPLNVIIDHQSHCLDGGLFAALALWRIGYKPLLVDLVPYPGTDDDHVLALFQIEGRWGAVAKSNYVNLGFREAVHKTIRELAMTYFEHYCSVDQTKTLRGYTRPFDVSRYTKFNWALDEAGTNQLFYNHFYGRNPVPLISQKIAEQLNGVSDRVYKAETMYTDLNWSFGIRPNH